jgi:hypothetical protein
MTLSQQNITRHLKSENKKILFYNSIYVNTLEKKF